MSQFDRNKFYDTDVPLIRCYGTYHQIGLKHGSLAKERISKNIKTYEKLFQEISKISWKEAKRRAEQYISFLNDKAPELVQEMHGIATGAGIDFLDILTMNVRSEISLTNYSDGCSAISQKCEYSGNTFISQNWDWIEGLKYGLVILEIKTENSPKILTITEAGIVGKIGFNEAGLGLMLNAINCGVSQIALPVHIANRKCLETESVDAAISELKKYGVASTSNIVLADRGGKFLSLEASPKGFATIGPNENGVVAHTNHLYAEERYVNDHPSPNSFTRLERLLELGKNSSASFENIRKRLSDEKNYPYSISRDIPDKAEGLDALVTIATLIINLSAGEGQISFGRPSENPKKYRLAFS